MNPRRNVVLGGLLVVGLCANVAVAQNYGGDGYNLSVGVWVAPQNLVGQALQMPAVQTAITVFVNRGYVRTPSGDQGNQTVSTYGPNFSSVVLSFEKPGITQHADTMIAPVIVISTVQDYTGLTPSTIVDGALLTLVHTQSDDSWSLYVAEYSPVSQFAVSDYSFTVPSDAMEPTYSEYAYAAPATDPELVGMSNAQKFAACIGWAHLTFAAGCLAANCGPALVGCLTPAGAPLCIAGYAAFTVGTGIICGWNMF